MNQENRCVIYGIFQEIEPFHKEHGSLSIFSNQVSHWAVVGDALLGELIQLNEEVWSQVQFPSCIHALEKLPHKVGSSAMTIDPFYAIVPKNVALYH